MNYKEFISTVVEQVKSSLPSDATVKIHNVTKNNSLHLDGLSIFYKKSDISPNIYLNSYYEDYLRGDTIDEITSRIMALFTQFQAEQSDRKNPFENFDKPDYKKIFYRLVNYGKNEELLRESPHIRYLDLAVTFHYLLNSEAEGIESFRITNHMAKLWQLSPQRLYEKAKNNTAKLFPGLIRPMHEILMDLIEHNPLTVPDSSFEKSLYAKDDMSMMYVLSTQNGINGATAVLYPELMAEFASRLESDFYVIPSSIHEMLLVPSRFAPSPDMLREMIEEVNKKEVPIEDILSDTPYFYNRKNGKLKMA